MNIKVIASIVFLFFIFLNIGCKSTAIKNIEEARFVVPANTHLNTIKKAIIRGSSKAGWRTKALQPGVLMASYSYKRNNFGAVVKINYDLDSYQIIYQSSHNLKYNDNLAKNSQTPEFIQDSKAFFSENNPFAKKDNLPVSHKNSATIHKIYNTWVTELETRINHELATLSPKKTSFTTNRRTTAPARCDDTPVYNSSGFGSISRSTVNIRRGAGTQCSILTTIRKNESFSLLGKKNNWYYITLNNGENGWIYAPLVNKVANNNSLSPTPRVNNTPAPPIPPSVPTKNISIAVIRFKTLNREAQDISLGELVSEIFTSALVNSRNFKIIEREQLDKLVREMEMVQTGFIESTNAVAIGKVLHADAIITGSVALLNGQVQLNARIIEVESAYVVSADTKTTKYTLKNINKIINDIVAKLARKLQSR